MHTRCYQDPRLFAKTPRRLRIRRRFDEENDATVYRGDCIDMLGAMPDGCAELVVTSPPYNIGKEYERRLDIKDYVSQQTAVINECARVLSDHGSICWQVGNFVEKGAMNPPMMNCCA